MKGELTEKEAVFLIEQEFDGESLDELNSIGYTLTGAARALSIAYDIPEDGMLDRLREAANRGDLKVRDPRTGLTYTPSICRDFYERVSIDDLNRFLESQNVPYRLEVAYSRSMERKKSWHIPRRFVSPEGAELVKAEELAERDGRGTISEAMSILLKETGEFFNIEKAVRDGEIPSYAPGSYKPLGAPEKNLVAALEEEEVYANDLNTWLSKKYLRVKFRFPEVGTGDTAPDSDRLKRSALIKEVEPYWPTIKEDLRHSDENKLSADAKIKDKHGYWNLAAAVKWATERGKIKAASKPLNKKSDAAPWTNAIKNLQK